MGKNNVNPDHYKVGGRERQGEDVVASEHKQRFVNVQHDLAARSEQRNQSLEAMRKRQEKPSGDVGAARASKAGGRKKAAKRAIGKASPREEETTRSDTRGRTPPAGAKKAVTRRPLPKKPGRSVPAGAGSSRVAKKKTAPARKK
jgi:hypothetical protein